MKIVTIKRYSEIEGITTDAIKKRIREGVWKIRREVKRIKGFRTLFVDTEAVERFFRDTKNQE